MEFENYITKYLLACLDVQMIALLSFCKINEDGRSADTSNMTEVEIAIHLGAITTTITMLESIKHESDDLNHAKGLMNNLASHIKLPDVYKF